MYIYIILWADFPFHCANEYDWLLNYIYICMYGLYARIYIYILAKVCISPTSLIITLKIPYLIMDPNEWKMAPIKISCGEDKGGSHSVHSSFVAGLCDSFLCMLTPKTASTCSRERWLTDCDSFAEVFIFQKFSSFNYYKRYQ